MDNEFLGFHSEWNLGSPGGWDYQRVTQELGLKMWTTIRDLAELDVELDFSAPILNPAPGFAELMLRAHSARFGSSPAFVVIVAEEETLDSVIENRNMVERLNRIPGVKARLAAPQWLEAREGKVLLEGMEPTVVFVDFNNDLLTALDHKLHCPGLKLAVRKGLTINPRGMEPVGVKCVFELIGSELRDRLSPGTVNRTPWTRKFFPRSTKGPNGEEINDIVDWTEKNWLRLVLKPENGYSGKGVFVGERMPDLGAECVDRALKAGDYILQELIPPGLWAEEFPVLNLQDNSIELKHFQTDFRCFITDRGLMGFVGRFGGIPTNVGAGGGTQAIAVLKSDIGVGAATRKINDAIADLGFHVIGGIKERIDLEALAMGHVYLNGPIPMALRPRLILPAHLKQLKPYASDLWNDAVLMAGIWRNGGMDQMVKLAPEVAELARLQPWTGQCGLMASDGLFSFGAHVEI